MDLQKNLIHKTLKVTYNYMKNFTVKDSLMYQIAGFCNFSYDYTFKEPFYKKVLNDMHDRLSHRGSNHFDHYLT